MKEKQNTSKWGASLRAAFPYTIPIFAGYWFLGLTYGILMNVSGFSFVWPMVMAAVIYSGSVEFVAVKVLLSSFHPLQAFVMAFMIGARHLFYGITMLDRFKHKGWKKPLLIYFMSDETFSVNYTAKIPKDVDEGWFMLWITLLDFLYWLTGATLGGIFGNLITFSTKGLDFVMTAMAEGQQSCECHPWYRPVRDKSAVVRSRPLCHSSHDAHALSPPCATSQVGEGGRQRI